MTYYEVLGVASDASAGEIRRAYVALARAHHPDYHTNDSPSVRAANERAMRAVNEAWAVLSDSAARRRYDDALRSRGGSGGQGGAGAGVGDAATRREARRWTRAEADEYEREAWQPLDPDDDDFVDPRLLDDEPDRVAVSRRRQFAIVLPTILFLAGVALVLFGLVINLLPVAGLGLGLVVLSALAFVVLPLLALSASARNDRR